MNLSLSLSEKHAIECNEAPRLIRLKCGRIIFDSLEAKFAKTGFKEEDIKISLLTVSMHEKAAFKEWLQVQLENYPDTLSSNSQELEEQMGIYRMCLNCMTH